MNEEEKKAIKRIEKHLIEMLNKYEVYNDCLDVQSHYRNGDIKILLNLIENQQKELDSLKEIEKSHKEENGLLRQELDMQIEHNKELENELDKTTDLLSICNKRLENISRELEITDEHIYGYDYGEIINKIKQEKERNKELEEKLKIAKQLYNDSCICIATECVEKDKIKEKIEEIKKKGDYRDIYNPTGRVHFMKEGTDYQIEVLEELLESE